MFLQERYCPCYVYKTVLYSPGDLVHGNYGYGGQVVYLLKILRHNLGLLINY